jgi:hypothetical protein
MKKMEMNAQVDEVSLLDLMLVVAENIKLLILGPLLVGLLALGVGFALPQKFTSVAFLSLAEGGKGVEAIMRTPAVVDAVLLQLQPNLSITDEARTELLEKIRFSSASALKTGANLAKFEVDGSSPADAQILANAFIDAWIATTRPQPQTKIELERKLKLNQEALKTVTTLIERQAGETNKVALPNLQFDVASSITQLLQLRNGYVEAIAGIESQLKGATRDVVLSPPMLPTEPVSSKKALMATLAALGTGFALLLFVFIRAAWRGAAQDPEAAQKQTRLRAALGLK